MKFPNELAKYLYNLSLDGLADAEMGSTEDLGWYAQFDLMEDEDPATEDANYAILEENSRRFVDVQTFATRFEMMREWSRVSEIYHNYYREQHAAYDEMINGIPLEEDVDV